MEKDTSVGKLVNGDTSAELSFSLAPTEFFVEEANDLRVEPCLGRAHPVVSYHGGAAKTLSTNLIFDKDADEKLDVPTLLKFLNDLAKVNKDTHSIPLVKFHMGNFVFQGYISRMTTAHTRFAASGQATQIKLSLALIAAEEEDNAR